MALPDILDRTVELDPEPLDDLVPLESTNRGPASPRPQRIQTVSRLPQLGAYNLAAEYRREREHERELEASRQVSERREQRHRHALERAQQRNLQEQELVRRKQEGRVMLAVTILVVVSGLVWIAMPAAEAAKIVFTMTFGALAGYLGGRRQGQLPISRGG